MSELNVPALLDRDEIGNPVSIARIEAFPLDLELTHSFHIASDSTKTDGTKNVLVRVESQDGYLGFGEAAPFHGISGDTQEGILTDIRSAIDALLNATFNIFRFERIARKILRFPASRAALEMALFDIMAKRANKPLATFLNPDARFGGHMTDITIPLVSPEVAAGQARMYLEQGFDRIKIKVGDSVEKSIQRIAAVVRAFKEGERLFALRLLLDANEGFCPEEALNLLDMNGVDLPRGALQIFEQPVGRNDMSAMKRVVGHALHMGCKVYADESIFTLQDAERVIGNEAAGGANLKLMKHGGIVEAMRIAEVAEQGGLAVMVGGMVESRLAMSAGFHLAAALNVGWCDLDTPLFMNGSAFTGGISYSGPHILPPTGVPGIGINPVFKV